MSCELSESKKLDFYLFELLEEVTDPRKKRGVRYQFHAVLKLVILGFTCRLVCLEHIVEFAKAHWSKIKNFLGFTSDTAPNATTIGRILKKIDRKEFETVFRKWVSYLVQGKEIRASVDGKALRNVCDEKGNPLFMINVFAHDIQLTLAQEEIPEKKGESTTFNTMLKDLFETYPGLRILTGDAAFAGRDLCKEITRLGRHYLVQIKGNQEKIREVLEMHFTEEKQERKADSIDIEKKKSKMKL